MKYYVGATLFFFCIVPASFKNTHGIDLYDLTELLAEVRLKSGLLIDTKRPA